MGNAGTSESLLNPFRAKCFIWNKHVSALCIIPPHWHDTGTWNPSLCTLTLMRGLSYFSLTLQGQYHGWWCPGALHRQDISSHDIDYMEYGGPSLTWGRILSTCVISMWITDMKCEFVFPLNNLARKGLMVESQGHQQICTDYVYKTKCPINCFPWGRVSRTCRTSKCICPNKIFAFLSVYEGKGRTTQKKWLSKFDIPEKKM